MFGFSHLNATQGSNFSRSHGFAWPPFETLPTPPVIGGDEATVFCATDWSWPTFFGRFGDALLLVGHASLTHSSSASKEGLIVCLGTAALSFSNDVGTAVKFSFSGSTVFLSRCGPFFGAKPFALRSRTVFGTSGFYDGPVTAFASIRRNYAVKTFDRTSLGLPFCGNPVTNPSPGSATTGAPTLVDGCATLNMQSSGVQSKWTTSACDAPESAPGSLASRTFFALKGGPAQPAPLTKYERFLSETGATTAVITDLTVARF